MFVRVNDFLHPQELYSSHELKQRIAEIAAKKHPGWLEAQERTERSEKSAERQAGRKSKEKRNTYPYLEVRGVIRLQMEAIKQCENDSATRVL